MIVMPAAGSKKAANRSQFGPKLITAVPGPLAQKIIADDDRLLSPSYTRSYPLVVKSGRGAWIEGGYVDGIRLEVSGDGGVLDADQTQVSGVEAFYG